MAGLVPTMCARKKRTTFIGPLQWPAVSWPQLLCASCACAHCRHQPSHGTHKLCQLYFLDFLLDVIGIICDHCVLYIFAKKMHPFSCVQCEESFSQEGDPKKHALSDHEKLKPFSNHKYCTDKLCKL